MQLFEILSVLEGEEVEFMWPSGKDQVFFFFFSLPGDPILLDKGRDLRS